MSAYEEFFRNNQAYAEQFDKADLPRVPGKHTAVLTCMDSRLKVYGILGMHEGDAHVIRNAGGIVTDDAIRSLIISQRLLGTTEILLIHHTDCGMSRFTDEGMRSQLLEEVGLQPEFEFHAFSDVEESVRQSIARIKSSPFIPHTDQVRGFVYAVETGKLHGVV